MESMPSPIPLPVFPLTGTLLLPGNYMPLNVFEPRYRHLVEDSLENERLIGMVQPRVPALDAYGPVAGQPDCPQLYDVGCIGRVEECEPQPDGRYVILLRGECRFRAERELPLYRGYRRVIADMAGFREDLETENHEIDAALLSSTAIGFSEKHGLEFDRDILESLPPWRLLHALCAALPFEPAEKQALLEAEDLAARQDRLLALMDMGLEPDDLARTPTLVN